MEEGEVKAYMILSTNFQSHPKIFQKSLCVNGTQNRNELKQKSPDEGLEPSTTGLKVLRSTKLS